MLIFELGLWFLENSPWLEKDKEDEVDEDDEEDGENEERFSADDETHEESIKLLSARETS